MTDEHREEQVTGTQPYIQHPTPKVSDRDMCSASYLRCRCSKKPAAVLSPKILSVTCWGWATARRATSACHTFHLCCKVLLEPAADLPTKTVNVTCWEWAGTARDEGDFTADWLSEVLGKPVRLVRYMGERPRVLMQAKWHQSSCYSSQLADERSF